MSLSPGSRVGPYEVVSAIGEGGMGQVYLARDTRLNRDAALKILPPSFSADPDRVARFHREAQTLAALNHPNVAQIYGVEDSPGGRALAMELVPGRTLAEIIAAQGGPMPIGDVLPIARQVVDALEAAHDAGIVHRDLKPPNIKVRDDGTVKVLDFGLAKTTTFGSLTSGSDPNLAPTMTSPAVTEMGIILGTATYMSPEQAKGRPVDKRADIWAFGCLLFEMLTGARLFGGETVQETLASVLKDSPKLDRLPAGVPRHIRVLLERCLDRDPRTRLRDIGEARIALARPEDQETSPPGAKGRHGYSGLTVGALVAAAAVFALIAGVMVWERKPASAAALRRFELPSAIAETQAVALAPDGSRLAYLSGNHLLVHNFTDSSTQDLGDVPRPATHPFWSADGRTIAFTGGGDLRTRPATGGPDFVVCRLPGAGRVMDAKWRQDNTIVFTVWRDNLYSVPAAGGAPTVLVAPDKATDVDFHAVEPLPDGRLILARHVRSDDSEHLELFDKGRSVPLTDDRSVGDMRYIAPGVLVFVRRGANKGVWAVPFDNPPLNFARATLIAAGATEFTVSSDGTLVHVTSVPPKSELVWADRSGSMTPIAGAPLEFRDPSLALSTDGKRAAFVMGSSTSTIYKVLAVRDLQTGADTRLTVEDADEAKQSTSTFYPAWVPSENRVLYGVGSAELTKIVVKEASGVTAARALTDGLWAQIATGGRDLYYVTDDHGRGRLSHAPIGSDGAVGSPSLVFPANENIDVGAFVLSPDGRLLAYEVRQPDRRINVWMTDAPNGANRWQVTTEGGRLPRFSHNGRELFYVGPANTGEQERGGALLSVPITVTPAIALGARTKLFVVDQAGGPSLEGGYDVAPDGRFLFSRTAAQGAGTARAVYVENWLVSVGK